MYLILAADEQRMFLNQPQPSVAFIDQLFLRSGPYRDWPLATFLAAEKALSSGPPSNVE
jgi:hypothetical protein